MIGAAASSSRCSQKLGNHAVRPRSSLRPSVSVQSRRRLPPRRRPAGFPQAHGRHRLRRGTVDGAVGIRWRQSGETTMNVSAAIIDQRLNRLAEELRERLVAELRVNASDSTKQKSLAFVYLCAKTMLDLEDDEAFEALTDGSNDFGVDAMHLSDVLDDEFV